MLGTLLHHRYKVIEVLGSGGFGQTYVAEDTHQPGAATCVVKHFRPAYQDDQFLKVARRLFSSEAEMLRRLGSHDRIPSLLDDFEDSGEFYLVQEYVRGQALGDELAKRETLPEAEVVHLLRDVLELLEFVHHNHVIHRDIKPSNLIRRQQDGRMVLIDFGAVKEIQTQITAMDGAPTNLTIGIGTQGYGPSEQLAGKPRYNSDIYALGMTAIQALTGFHPTQMPSHPDTGDVIWRDRVEVSSWLAAILEQMVRYSFTQRYQSATEVLQALNHPHRAATTVVPDDETLIPPTVMGSLATEPSLAPVTGTPSTAKPWRRRAIAALWVGLASLVGSGAALGLRAAGWLQSSELAVYDRLVQQRPDKGPDARLLIVGITEADIQAQKRFPLSDRTVAQALQRLKTYQPRAIGLDLLRDVPQEPGHRELLAELKDPRVIVITNIGTADNAPTPAPASVPAQRVGFNDLVLDPDSVVRRNLMFADTQDATLYSFSLRLALAFLAKEAIRPQPLAGDSEQFRLGQAQFRPLESDAGAYQGMDARGYQTLLNYRGRQVAEQVSLTDLLQGKVLPERVRDRVVLIGTTAANAKDLFFTPYSATEAESPRLPGVFIHAHMLSQILTAALDGGSLFWFWPDWAEVVWIVGWAVLGSCVAQWVRQPLLLLLAEVGLAASVGAIAVLLFFQNGWIPVVAPLVALALALGTLILARARRSPAPSMPNLPH